MALAVALAATLPTWLAPPPARAAGFDLDALMQRLAQVRAGEATFVERRQVFQPDQTPSIALESSGRLSFAAPDTFVRETLRPRRERLAVTGNQLVMTQGSRSRTTALDAVPEATVIVEAVRGTLTGNRETLERHFTIQLAGTAERWSLDLVPRDARLRGQVSQIRVAGRQAQLREVHLTMTDGDRSVMTIEPVAATAAASAP
jgi:outer membrane lipoprotein-sorting protein